MILTKESLASALGIKDILDLVLDRPKDAYARLAKLRTNGLTSVEDDEDLLHAFILGRSLWMLDRHSEAVPVLESAVAFAVSRSYHALAADCERELASSCIAQGDSERGMPHAERAMEFAKAAGDPLSVAKSKQQLATFLAMKGEDDLSIQYYLEAINVFERLDPTLVHSALNNYSHHFFKRGDSEAGIRLLREAVARSTNHGSSSIYLLNIATAQLDLGNTAEALSAAAESISLARKFGRESTVRKAKMIYAAALGQSDSAELFERTMERIEEAEHCFDRFEHLPSHALSLVYRAKLAAQKGHSDEAMDYLREAQSLDLEDKMMWDMVFTQTIEEVQRSSSNWADAYSALKKFEQISESLRKAESTRMLYANPVGSLKGNELKQDEKYTLKEQLDRRAKDLVTIREETAKVTKEIDHIVRTAPNLDAIVKAVRDQIAQFPERLDYDAFESEFVQSYPSFFPVLRSTYPDLTPIQLRICCVTRAGLRSPEASTLLNVSERTIQNHRYRIKKLFGIKSTDPLSTFLQKF
jgi:tetratricopeptide (TPR) repeat protein/DNA-binding CsgD family transcriptional regulator